MVGTVDGIVVVAIVLVVVVASGVVMAVVVVVVVDPLTEPTSTLTTTTLTGSTFMADATALRNVVWKALDCAATNDIPSISCVTSMLVTEVAGGKVGFAVGLMVGSKVGNGGCVGGVVVTTVGGRVVGMVVGEHVDGTTLGEYWGEAVGRGTLGARVRLVDGAMVGLMVGKTRWVGGVHDWIERVDGLSEIYVDGMRGGHVDVLRQRVMLMG